MLRLSWSTFRERWHLSVGAIVTVCLGVALVQSALLTLISAAVPDIPAGLSPAEETALRDGYVAAISLLGMVLGLATFVAVFIVAATFAFTVAQRRRELALFRLTGASRRQVRALLTGEALLLGAVGTVLGVVLGLPVMRLQGWLLVRLDFVPPGFTVAWRPWIIAVSAGVGLAVAVLGVLGASRRASRLRPLEALRETGSAARVMTWPRWVVGCVFLAGAVAMLTLTLTVNGEAAVPLALNACLVLVVALSAFAPLFVPLVGGVVGGLVRMLGGPVGRLAHANLRDGVRRSAATAAPVMVLVGLVAGLGGTLDTITAASRDEMTRAVDAELVVTAAPSLAAKLSTIDGVGTVCEQVPVSFTLISDDNERVDGLAIDPVAYARTHRVGPVTGELSQLHGKAIAVSGGYGFHPRVGNTVRVRVDGDEMRLRVVALLPATLSGPEFLLPLGLMPPGGPAQYVVRVDSGVDAGTVAD